MFRNPLLCERDFHPLTRPYVLFCHADSGMSELVVRLPDISRRLLLIGRCLGSQSPHLKKRLFNTCTLTRYLDHVLVDQGILDLLVAGAITQARVDDCLHRF